MKRKKSIVYLKRNQLEPHPQNPRKDLGDLEELRESIKVNGIMQNLTVVPTDDSFEHFRILIGHRRFDASEGILDELPCIIAEDLTDREQVGIMLCENLQRNDLTYYEQGQGFQMMLDLGDDIDAIEKKTGFSRTTIKHRIEIAKLSKKSIEKDRAWQLSLTDLALLEKIENIKEREKILNCSYSSENLSSRVNSYIRDERIKKNTKAAEKILKSLNIKKNTKTQLLHWGSDYKTVITIDLTKSMAPTLEDFEKISDRMKVDYIYEIAYRELYVMTKIKKEKAKKSAADIKYETLQALVKKINEEGKKIASLYIDFILDTMPGLNIAKHPDEDMIEAAWELCKLTKPGFYNCEIRDELTLDEALKDSSPYRGMLLLTAMEIKNSRLIGYDNNPIEHRIEVNRKMIEELKTMGFFIPMEIDENLVTGKSDLYAKLENLKS